MSTLIRKLKYTLWTVNGYLGQPPRVDVPQQVTVLITYYNPGRMCHIDSQVRNLLQCRFVEQIVLSNHNPEIRIEDQVNFRNDRLVFFNQPVQRGCGYRWVVAQDLHAPYLIVIDDDVLLYPAQLAQLFQALVKAPAVPHGFTGMHAHDADHFEYCEYQEATVDYLCEVYAVTQAHIQRYWQLYNAITSEVAPMIDSAVDFMLISQSGNGNPQIHNAGQLLRCTTFKQQDIAIHQTASFHYRMQKVYHALAAYKLSS